MSQRKKYFISIERESITETPVDDTTEYEIDATDEEVEKLEELFQKKDKHEKKAVKFLAKPFNEWGADDEREAYDTYLTDIFKYMYELGTPQTKQKIKSIGIDR